MWLPDEPEPEHEHHPDIEHPLIKEASPNTSKRSSVAPPQSTHEHDHRDGELPEEPPAGEGSQSSRRTSLAQPEPEVAPRETDQEAQVEHEEGVAVNGDSVRPSRSSAIVPEPENGENSGEPLAASSKRSSVVVPEQAQVEQAADPTANAGASTSKPPSVVDSARG